MKSFRSTDSSGTVYGDGTFGLDKIEADPDGNSVGFTDPGLGNPTESNDLFTSGWSFGSLSTGQNMTYSIDGIHVPKDYFLDRIDNGAGDLALKLLEFSVTQSFRIREWRFIGVDGYDRTFPVGQVTQHAVDMLNRGWANAYAILDDSWSAINLISVQTQQQTQPRLFGFSNDRKNRILRTLDQLLGNEACTAAFKAAGVTTIADQLADGLTILEKLFVQNSENDRLWVPDGGQELADGFREAYLQSQNFLGISKASDVALNGTVSGGRYFSLSSRSFDSIDEHFQVVFVHALVHTGGKSGRGRHFTGRYYNNRREPIINPKTNKPISGTGAPFTKIQDMISNGWELNTIG